MKVVADKYIPFLRGILEPYAEVLYMEPEEITAETVREADALLVRTRTRCNAALLDGSRVRFVATATIGYDHIDTQYCEEHGIFWTNSPGCNAQGVCDYIEEVLRVVESNKKKEERQEPRTIGIVGVGHVGSLVAEMAELRGYRVLLNDPPKEMALRDLRNLGNRSDLSNLSGLSSSSFVPLDTIARESDIVTFHTPLTRSGDYPTWHLCDKIFLEKCKPDAVIINAARGGILDEEAALYSLNIKHSTLNFIIDTWQGEPGINKEMLDRATIATYHIAGYTLQGKINATNLCLSALCKYFSLPVLQIQKTTLPLQPKPKEGWIMDVDKQLREHPELFETLRETYPLR